MQQTVEFPQVKHTESIVDRVVPLPVAVRDHVPMVQNAVEAPHAHYIDKDREGLTSDATPSAVHPDSSDATTGASDADGPEDRRGPVPKIMDIAVPQIVLEQIAEVIKVPPFPPPNVRPQKIIPGRTDIQANSGGVQTDTVLINSGAGGHLGHLG